MHTSRGLSFYAEGLTARAADSISCVWIARHRPCPVVLSWYAQAVFSPESCAAVDRAAAEAMLGLREQEATAADSAWLTFTAPRHGSLGCEPDTAKPLHGGQRVYLIRLRGQVPNYWPGMMQTVAGMDSVRLLTRPDTVWRAAVQPGVRCSVRVGAGEYVAETQGQRCARWRVVRVP